MIRRIAALALSVLTVLVVTSCSSPPSSSTTRNPTHLPEDTTSSLVGTWVPVDSQTLRTLELNPDGTVVQAVSAGVVRGQNVGTWGIESPGILLFTFPRQVVGVPVARYRYKLGVQGLTLEWAPDSRRLPDSQYWVDWITGSDHAVLALRRRR